MVGAGMGPATPRFSVGAERGALQHSRHRHRLYGIYPHGGSAIGTAILGATLNLNLQWRLPEIDDPVQRLMEPAVRQSMGSEALAQLIQQVAASLHWVFPVSALVSLLALAAAMLIPARCRPQGEEEEGGAGLREKERARCCAPRVAEAAYCALEVSWLVPVCAASPRSSPLFRRV